MKQREYYKQMHQSEIGAVSETLDWIKHVQNMGHDTPDKEQILSFINVVTKDSFTRAKVKSIYFRVVNSQRYKEMVDVVQPSVSQ